jgi:hypothetical protein
MRKYITIISLGVVNILHASLHILQAVQSFLLVNSTPRHFGEKYMMGVEAPIWSQILHSPYFSVVWAVIGIFTLYIGVKDFIHHRKCKK